MGNDTNQFFNTPSTINANQSTTNREKSPSFLELFTVVEICTIENIKVMDQIPRFKIQNSNWFLGDTGYCTNFLYLKFIIQIYI